MQKGTHPEKPQINSEALKANQEVGYSANNPEPAQMKDSVASDSDGLHSALEYINHHAAGQEEQGMSNYDEQVFVAGTEDGITAELESSGVTTALSPQSAVAKNTAKNQSAEGKHSELF